MKTFQLSAGTTFVDVDLGSAGFSISAMALEVMGFGETTLTSISTPDIQDQGAGIYRITFTEAVLDKTGFILFSLVSASVEFDPFFALLFTTTKIGDREVPAGIPVNKEAFLPVRAFDTGTSDVVIDLDEDDFDLFFTKADEAEESTKAALASADIIQVVNEFGTKRGIYLIRFTAAELDRVGVFKYRAIEATASPSPFDDFALEIPVLEPVVVAVTLEVRDTSPGIITPIPTLPENSGESTFIGNSVPFNRLEFQFKQTGSGYAGVTFEYFNGTAFTGLTVVDGTDNALGPFSQDGIITWELPTDQVAGGPGAPNATDYFIKITAAAISDFAELFNANSGVNVAGVIITIRDLNGIVVATGTTNQFGKIVVQLASGDYRALLQKGSLIFSFNNVKFTILDTTTAEAAGATTFAQLVILEGETTSFAGPSVNPDLILLKVDLVNLAGAPICNQEIQLQHKFDPPTFSGSKAVVGPNLLMRTDATGHDEQDVIAGSLIDIFLVNTAISRQIKVPLPRSGTGSSVDPAPTPKFVTVESLFVGSDVQAIITIAGVDHVITRVEDAQNIEVSPDIDPALVGAAWSMKKIDLFSLVAVAQDQFQVAIPVLDRFSVRTTLP